MSTVFPAWSKTGANRLVVALAVFFGAIPFASPAIATLWVENYMEGDVSIGSDSLVLYNYSSATDIVYDDTPDWDLGTYNGTRSNATGRLELARYGDVAPRPAPAWWDAAWRSRQCVTVTNPGTADTGVPEDVLLDTATLITNGWLSADAADLRAVDSATGLELPLWIEGTVPSATTKVWVKLADVPNGDSEFCFYLGNATATSVSDQASVFSGSSLQSVYYTMTDRYTGTGTAGQVSVVSYTDGNLVSDGTTTVTLNRGQVHTFSGLDAQGEIRSSLPIAGSGHGNTTDSLIPLDWAAAEFVFPSFRNSQSYWVRSPFAATTIEVVDNGVVTDSVVVSPADGAVHIVEEIANNRSATLRSVDGTRFLAAHVAGSVDAHMGITWLGETIYGIDSTSAYVGTSVGGATIDSLSSTGDVNVGTVIGANTDIRYLSSLSRPSGKAWAIDSDLPISAIQQADSNGYESTVYYPTSYLDAEYYVAERFRYASFACPVSGTTITMTDPSATVTTYTCSTTGGAGAPGQANTPLGDYPAGTLFTSSDPFFMFYENWGYNDEKNVISHQAAMPVGTNSIVTTLGSVEGSYVSSGTWTVIADTGSSGVYGLLDWLATLPASTTASVQIASGSSLTAANAAVPVGPDGTAATSFTPGVEIIPYPHDFNQFFKVEVTLSTSDAAASPEVPRVAFGHSLSPFVVDSEAIVYASHSASPALTKGYLARVYFAPPTMALSSTISYQTASGLADSTRLTVKTDHPATHIDLVGGAVNQSESAAPFTIDAGSPFSIVYDEATASGGTVTLLMRLQGQEASGLVFANDIHLTLISP